MTHILYKVVFALRVNEQVTSIEVIFAINHFRTHPVAVKAAPLIRRRSTISTFWHLPSRYPLVIARLGVVIGVCKFLKDGRPRHEQAEPIASSARRIKFS
jgi:hypothetical protein